MSTDYCALCAELADALDSSNGFLNSDGEWVVPEPIGTIVDRARAALAQPEPVGPTDEELRAAYDEVCWGEMDADNFIKATRAVLQRWGRPAITPISVSERLPGAEDCDAEGRCWWAWAVGQVWSFCSPPPYRATHWLPAHALPLPRQPAPDAAAP